MSQRFKLQILLLCVLSALVISSTACGIFNDPKGAIIGRWQQVGGGQVLAFFQDGTVTVGGAAGSYRWLDDKTIQINTPSPFIGTVSQVYEVSISGDKLRI